jgi:hypothetical protein
LIILRRQRHDADSLRRRCRLPAAVFLDAQPPPPCRRHSRFARWLLFAGHAPMPPPSPLTPRYSIADTYFRRRLPHADARFSTPLDIRHARWLSAAVLRQRAIVYSFADAVFTPAAAADAAAAMLFVWRDTVATFFFLFS